VQNIVASQRDVFPSLFAPFCRDEIGKLTIALGSSRVRFGGEGVMPVTGFLRRWNRLKHGLELVLGGGVRRGKTEYRRRGRDYLLELRGECKCQEQSCNKRKQNGA